VFRLGDITKTDITQIWEHLEDQGLRVGAISPMNAKHRLRNAAFFVPDPWTSTGMTAPGPLQRLYNAVSQAVNDNAQSRLTAASAVHLVWGLLQYSRPRNYLRYLRLAAQSLKGSWRRAIFLDLLLADIFIKEVARTGPHFATLFLNAGAHIQHHYLFSASCYRGPHRNPEWYLKAGVDPVREVYEQYDHVLGSIRERFPAARLMIATAIHQEPHGRVTYYWRLRRHDSFLRKIGVSFVRVEPRMSRDFLVVCASEAQASEAEQRLAQAITEDGQPLFEVDNRGSDLFVMLTYPSDVGSALTFTIGSEKHCLARDEVAFVALKNGEHSGIGYFLDTGSHNNKGENAFPLTDIPRRVAEALGVAPPLNVS
jgi:hypothetical protein